MRQPSLAGSPKHLSTPRMPRRRFRAGSSSR